MIKFVFDGKLECATQVTFATDVDGNPVLDAKGEMKVVDVKAMLTHPQGGVVALPIESVPLYLAKQFGKAGLEIVEAVFVEAASKRGRNPLNPIEAAQAFAEMVIGGVVKSSKKRKAAAEFSTSEPVG